MRYLNTWNLYGLPKDITFKQYQEFTNFIKTQVNTVKVIL